jgi:hypothetical protein
VRVWLLAGDRGVVRRDIRRDRTLRRESERVDAQEAVQVFVAAIEGSKGFDIHGREHSDLAPA